MSSPPAWAEWHRGPEYSLGAEEEIMLLNPRDWSLAQQMDRVMPALTEQLRDSVAAETHRSVLEVNSSVHGSAGSLADELMTLRCSLEQQLMPMGLRCASAATHPFTVWHDTVLSSGARYETVYDSMRELARREPTFALHVHVGVPDPENGIRLANRMRTHLPLLLALSVNSPFWQGRDSGLKSARTPLFQAFPRVGIPRAFASYEEWVETVDLMVRAGAFPDASFLWWDVRLQPRFGTVEVRVMDAQSTVADTAALVALVQCIARLEVKEGYAGEKLIRTTEVLAENRFVAARDGMAAELIDPDSETRRPAAELLASLLEACGPHAEALGCEEQLAPLAAIERRTGAERQLDAARRNIGLPGLMEELAGAFCIRDTPLAGARTDRMTASP